MQDAVGILQLKEHCVQQFVAPLTLHRLTGLGVFHAAGPKLIKSHAAITKPPATGAVYSGSWIL